ncbi:MAG: DUF5063 domain-containing protein [Chlorobi bacterium]|nr:DUF5063 domain-containing protein [Chlorobiota bacterium]
MEDSFSHVVYSKNVIEFVTVAGEFCNILENTNQYLKKDFINISLKVLPLLYLKASVLPKTEEELDNEFIDKAVDEGLYQFILNSVRNKMGQHDDYLEVFTADMQHSDMPLTATISEDLADIYQDIKNFIESYKTAVTEIMNDALLELTNNFELYWGQRLVNTLRALHNVYYSGEDLTDEEQKKQKEEEDKKRNTDEWIISKVQKMWQDDNDDLDHLENHNH